MKIKFIILPALCSLLYACSGNQKPVDLTRNAKAAYPSADIKTAQVVEKTLSSSARLPGQLIPFNEVNVFPRVNGFVKQLYVDRGTVVKKGQLMVTLEAPEMQSQLQAARSRFLQAQENAIASKEKYERLKEAAREPGSVSPLELDNALNQWKGDQAIAESERSNVASVRTMQGYLNLYAPFNGVIVQRNVSPGALVSPGKATDQPMFVLQDIRKLRLQVSIPEDYVDKVDLSQPVTFVFNALPGQQHSAKISRSANALGSLHQEDIEIDVMNPNGKLKPGMFAEVNIPMASGPKSLLVPGNAIVRSTERQYVVIVQNGKAHLVDVKTGLVNQASTEVFGDLKAGDRVLMNATDNYKEGDNLRAD